MSTAPVRTSLLDDALLAPEHVSPELWSGSFLARESSLHQLAPYVGKMKSGMARVLLSAYSSPGDWVLDPFCGSGVVTLESLLLGRRAAANDLNTYAHVVTLGKATAAPTLSAALARAERLAHYAEKHAASVDLSTVPEWVAEFFHPRTLPEVVAAFEYCRLQGDCFLAACLCGILHHVRPGFLSYPASHMTPYLRAAKYPRNEFRNMYEYRDLRSRIIAKVRRMYRRTMLHVPWSESDYEVHRENAMSLNFDDESMDLVLSSPPYFGALDYARDNRLRLWFLGVHDWKELDSQLTASEKVYVPQMRACLREMHRVLKAGRYCILVLGDVDRNGRSRRTAELVADLASQSTHGGFCVERLLVDEIPDDRRSRRRTRTTRVEKVLVMRKLQP
jgi:hypothetical protein